MRLPGQDSRVRPELSGNSRVTKKDKSLGSDCQQMFTIGPARLRQSYTYSKTLDKKMASSHLVTFQRSCISKEKARTVFEDAGKEEMDGTNEETENVEETFDKNRMIEIEYNRGGHRQIKQSEEKKGSESKEQEKKDEEKECQEKQQVETKGGLVEEVIPSDEVAKMNRFKEHLFDSRTGTFLKLVSDKERQDSLEKKQEKLGPYKLAVWKDNKEIEDSSVHTEEGGETRLKEVRCAAIEHDEDEKDDLPELPEEEKAPYDSLLTLLDSTDSCMDSLVSENDTDVISLPQLNSFVPQIPSTCRNFEGSQQDEELSLKEQEYVEEDKDDDTTSICTTDRQRPAPETDVFMDAEEFSSDITLVFDENLLLCGEQKSIHMESFKDISKLKIGFVDTSLHRIHWEEAAMERCLSRAYEEDMNLDGTSLIHHNPTSDLQKRTSHNLVTSFTSCSDTVDMRDLVPSLLTSRTLYIRVHPFCPLKKREKAYWSDEPLVCLSRSKRRTQAFWRNRRNRKFSMFPRKEDKFAQDTASSRPNFESGEPYRYTKTKQTRLGRGDNYGRCCSERGGNSSSSSFNENSKGGQGKERGDGQDRNEEGGRENRPTHNGNNDGNNDEPGQPGKDRNTVGAIVQDDFKSFKKKMENHGSMSEIKFAEFLGRLAGLCNDQEGTVIVILDDNIVACLKICMSTLIELSDEMLECCLCTTLNSLLKHFADCESAYNNCQTCVQIFSLVCSHANQCSHAMPVNIPPDEELLLNQDPATRCDVALCQKICHFIDKEEISSRVRVLWMWLRKNLARVMGEGMEVQAVEMEGQSSTKVTQPLSRRPTSTYMPSLTSISESGGAVSVTSGSESRGNSRKLARKRSNLTDVEEKPASPDTEPHGETAPNSIQFAGSFASESETSSTEESRGATNFRSLPIPYGTHTIQRGEQHPSFVDQVTGEPGIGEVVYGQKKTIERVANHWGNLQLQYRREGQLHRQYREEGVIFREYAKNLRISYHRYQLNFQWVKNAHLGNGMTGKCHLATDFETDFNFCVKEIHISNYESLEVEIWSDLDHPCVVKFYGAIRVNENIYLLSEFIDGGCLTEAINAQRELSRRLSHVTALTYYKQILEVLVYLKKKQILHEDIKADNILLCRGTLAIKIVDFGLAHRINKGVVPVGTKPFGTQTQWSPEKARSGGYGHPAEVWASNCVLVHMLSGFPPWVRRFAAYKILHVVIVEQSPPLADIPSSIQADVQDLLKLGFIVEPQRRPSSEQLLQHHAFSILNSGRNNGVRHQSIFYSVLHSNTQLESYKQVLDVKLESLRSPLDMECHHDIPNVKAIPSHIFEMGNQTQNQQPIAVYPVLPGGAEGLQGQSNTTQTNSTPVAQSNNNNSTISAAQGLPSNNQRSNAHTASDPNTDFMRQYLKDNQAEFLPPGDNTASLEEYSPPNLEAPSDPGNINIDLIAQRGMIPDFDQLITESEECEKDDDIFKDFVLEEASVMVLNENAESNTDTNDTPANLPTRVVDLSHQIDDQINSDDLFMSESHAVVTMTTAVATAVTALPTVTPSVTGNPTVTPSVTGNPTVTPSVTTLSTVTPSVTGNPTVTPSVTGNPTVTPSVTTLSTVTPSVTGNPTVTSSVTALPIITPSVSGLLATPSAGQTSPEAVDPESTNIQPAVIREPSTMRGGCSTQARSWTESDEMYRLPAPQQSPDVIKPIQGFDLPPISDTQINKKQKKDQENTRRQIQLSPDFPANKTDHNSPDFPADETDRNISDFPTTKTDRNISDFLTTKTDRSISDFPANKADCNIPDFKALSLVQSISPIVRRSPDQRSPRLSPTPQTSSPRTHTGDQGSRRTHPDLHLEVPSSQRQSQQDVRTAPPSSVSRPIWNSNNSDRQLPIHSMSQNGGQALRPLNQNHQTFSSPPNGDGAPLLHHSVSTPQSMSDMQKEEFDKWSKTSESTYHLNQLYNEPEGELDREDHDEYNSNDMEKSIAQYIDEDTDFHGSVTVVKKGTDEQFTMRIEGECCNKTWEYILTNELNHIHDHFDMEKFTAVLDDTTFVNLEEVVGRRNITIYIQHADETDHWFIEAGMVYRWTFYTSDQSEEGQEENIGIF